MPSMRLEAGAREGTVLLDVLESATGGGGEIRFLPDHPDALTLGDMWRQAAACGRWLQNAFGSDGGVVAAALSATPASLALLLGAWRAGFTVASLPHPVRGVVTADYRADLRRLLRTTGAQALFVDDKTATLVDDLGVPTRAWEEAGGVAAAPLREQAGALVQFTSGATGEPKGVHLGLDAVAANIDAILTRLAPDEEFVSCSWLPLSHDMGLIGMCLGAWTACAPAWCGRGTVVLLRADAFATNPGMWFGACTRFRATVTTAPGFALDLVRPMLTPSRNVDLSSIQSFIIGSEPINAQTMRSFADAAAPFGFRTSAFCPAYGMAEASLCVTLVPPSEPWSTTRVSADGLRRDEWADADAGDPTAVEVVSCGPPIPGMDVVVDGDAAIGPLRIAGPSLLARYVDAAAPALDGVWLDTGDVGCATPAGVFVLGRRDELICVDGNTLYPTVLEKSAGRSLAVRHGQCIALPAEGGYRIVAEHRRGRFDTAGLDRGAHQMGEDLAQAVGTPPRSVVYVLPGSLPRTPSGKRRRAVARGLLAEHRLAVQWESRLD